MKRILCMLLAVLCVFFTGCNSILTNGDLRFKSFPPVTLPDIEEGISQASQGAQNVVNYEKYKVEGLDAFYMLPQHVNVPNQILDFKVLDYNSNGCFIYCYETQYNGTDMENGLGSTPRSGYAPEERVLEEPVTPGENLGDPGTMNVLVMMSYQPQTRAYKVFYCATREREEGELITNQDENMDGEELSALVHETSIMANRLVKKEEYFLFDDPVAYVFDKDGNEIMRSDFSVAISQEIGRLREEAVSTLRMNAGLFGQGHALRLVRDAECTISDVVMDGSYNVYVPISIEIVDEQTREQLENDDLPIEDDEDTTEVEEEGDDYMENNVYMTIVALYQMDVGGSEGISFFSRNQNWEKQLDYWKTLQYDPAYPATDGDFPDLQTLQAYQKKYTMDRIKDGTVGNLPDDFEVFHTEENSLNMELAYVNNLYSINLPLVVDGSVVRNISPTFLDLCLLDPSLDRIFWNTGTNIWLLMMVDRFNPILTASYLQQMDPLSRSRIHYSAKKVLTQMAQGQMTEELLEYLDASYANKTPYLYIPWMRPGTWDSSSRMNQLPFSSAFGGWWEMEALFAYKTSYYTGSSGETQEVGRYLSAEFKDRYGLTNPTASWKMDYTIKERSSASENTRTLSYLETIPMSEVQETDEIVSMLAPPPVVTDPEVSSSDAEPPAEEEVQAVVRRSVTETLPSYPLEYVVKFPEGTKMEWSEETGKGEMIAPSGDFGAIYYSVIQDNGEDSITEIHYNDGTAMLLDDQNVPGTAMDAGELYYADASGETEIIALVTGKGIKFYPKKNGRYSIGDAIFVDAEDLTNASSHYSLSLMGGDWAYLSDESGTDSQDETIRKNLEEGNGSDMLEVAGMSLLNEKEVILPTLSSGLNLVNIRNGIAVHLQDGAYYAAYMDKTTGDSEENRSFMLVGFHTSEYYYEPSDLSWAKYYHMDLAGQNEELESEILIAYLDSVYHGYMNLTHRLRYQESTGTYEIVEATDEERQENAATLRLLYGDESSLRSGLQEIVGKFDFEEIPEDVWNYALELSQKARRQRQCLQELYRFAGLGEVNGIPTEAWLLEQEGLLVDANYTNTLEDILVQLRLSDTAIQQMPSARREEYREYKSQMEAEAEMNDRGSEVVGSGELELEAMRASAYYQAVLEDLKEEFALARGLEIDTEIDTAWEDYMEEMLRAVNPDAPLSAKEAGINELIALMKVPDTVALDRELLESQVSGIRRVVDLEALILSYKLEEARYQGSTFHQELADYQAILTFESEKERQDKFRSAGFYTVIQELIEEDKELLEGTTWDAELSDILMRCGAGLVIAVEQEELVD